MTLNELIREVHANAVVHGWWEENRPVGEVLALIHSEWSEALEELRAGRDDVWYGENGKPEGFLIELIDGIIRLLDFMGKESLRFTPDMLTVRDCSTLKYSYKCGTDAQLVNTLHDLTVYISTQYSCKDLLGETGTDLGNKLLLNYFNDIIGVIVTRAEQKGFDVEKLLIEKHEYNKSRPYKHGKKF